MVFLWKMSSAPVEASFCKCSGVCSRKDGRKTKGCPCKTRGDYCSSSCKCLLTGKKCQNQVGYSSFYTHCIGNLFSRWNITVAVRMTCRKTIDLRPFQSFVVKFSILCCQYSRCLQIHSAAMKPFYISHRLILLDQRGGEQTLGREINLLAVIQELMVIKMVLPLSACQKCRNVPAKMWR